MSARPHPDETRIRAALRLYGFTQNAIAAAANLSKYRVSDVLLGRGGDDDRDLVEQAARRLFTDRQIPFPSTPWASAQDTTTPGETMTTPAPLLLSPDALTRLGLKADPFDDFPGMRLHLSRRTQFNRAHLVRAIQSRRIVAIVAGAGGGKSTLLRLIHTQVQTAGIRVLWLTPGNLDRTTINEGSLAACILRDLEQPVPNSAEERGEALRVELERRAAAGEFPVLVIDEAHDLSADGLIAIKRIWDSFTFNRAIGVVLAGQPPLLRRLRHDPTVQEVAGRCLVVEIPPMTHAEVRDYVDHRCAQVGADGAALFTDAAITAIAHAGGTAPLWINAIAQGAIHAAHQLALEVIDSDAVLAARR